MRERITQLAKGKIEDQSIQISLSVLQIEENVTVDDKKRGDFLISCPEEFSMKGLVYSTNQKVSVLTGRFLGKECRIYYEVDTTGENGDLSGEFQIVSNGGEFTIPYLFHIKGESLDGKEIRTLEEFAALAEEQEEEALKLFESPRFSKLPFMQDTSLSTIYEGLCNKGDRYNSLEELLVAAGARKPVHISLPDKQKTYPSLQEAVCDDLVIKRSGTGFLRLSVSSDCDFIRLDRSDVSDLDFDGDTCALMYTILPAKLHPGINFGTISVRELYETETLSVKVITKSNLSYSGGIAYKKDIAGFVSMYLKLVSGEMEENLLLNSMQTVLNHAREYAPNSYSVPLYQTDISIRQGKMEQAEELLNQAKSGILEVRDKDVATYCYYMWLKAKISQDPAQKQNMIKLLRKYYDEHVAEDMVFFVLMQDDPDLKENESLTLSRLKEHFRKDCNSPYLFLAGADILKKNPDLLRVLDEYEIRCLNFGSRHGLISEELAKTAAKLAIQVKHHKILCLNILKRLYRIYEEKDILTGICALMIRLDYRDKAAFEWYKLGVSQDIRLTRLYEYYLYALPEDFEEPLPRMILLYFAMNNTLDYRAQSSLYLNILEYMRDDEEITRAYGSRIESFAVDQLLQSHMNEKLARIYSYTIYPGMVDEKIAAILPKLLYAKKITCGVPGMRQAILSYEEVRGETVAQMKGDITYLPVYLEHAHVIFQDDYGNRFANIPYELSPVMNAPELEECLKKADRVHNMIHLRECLEIIRKGDYTEDDINILKELSQSDDIRGNFRRKLISEIISYYYREEELSACDGYLLTIDKKLLKKEDRLKVMETLIAKDFYEEAYKMAGMYGYSRLSISGVMKMTSRMILRRLYEKEDFLLELAVYCFRKERCDEVILEYLCQHYNGVCRSMAKVFTEARSRNISLYDLPERLLAQMLFCGAYTGMDEVYECYCKGKNCDNLLLHAYLTVKARAYFESEDHKRMPFLRDLEQWMLREETAGLSEICMLALTRYYADMDGLTDAEAELCQKMVDLLMKRKIYFRYYRRLVKFITLPRDFLEDTLIVYRGKPGQKLWIREVLLPSMEETAKESMSYMFDGFYCRKFSLLCGEKLQYEIYEDEHPDTVLSSGTLTKEESPYGKNISGPGSRVDELNELLETDAAGDFATWQDLAMNYAMREEMVEKMFQAL